MIFRAYIHYVQLLFESSVTLWNRSKISILFRVLDIYSLIFKACNLLSKLHGTRSVSRLNDLPFMNLSSFYRKRFCLDTKHLSMNRQISATSENHCKKGYEQREIEIKFKTPQTGKQLSLHSPTSHTYIVLLFYWCWFFFRTWREDTWLVWKLIRSLVHLKSLFLNSTCKYVMSINLETAEKTVLCVITQGVGFLLWYWNMTKSQSPTKNPLSDDRWKEDWRSGIISGHVPCPFSLEQTSTCDLFAMIQGFKTVSLSLSITTCPSPLTSWALTSFEASLAYF